MQDAGPAIVASIVAAIVALIVSIGRSFVAHRLAVDPYTTRYITSLQGLVAVRDAEIEDLKDRINDLEQQNRILSRRVELLEGKAQ